MEKKLINKLLEQIKIGTLKVTYWDGETISYGSGKPEAHLSIKNRSLLRKMIRNPSVALGEAYMNGDIVAQEPFEDLLKLGELNPVDLKIISNLKLPKPRLRKNKQSKQATYIEHHYDVGNDFYSLWLDKETMQYTCAYFKTPRDSLAKAQLQKIDHVLRKLQIKSGQSVLDIGCGWGHLLITAAEKYGAKGLGVTLSKEQHAYATAEAKRRGLSKQIKFELLNYQDLLKRKTQFDRVVSVGILEHIGAGNHKTYFDVVDHTLKDGGISVLHSISHMLESPSDAWIDKYIFPGGYIPSVREITSILPEKNFCLFDYENIGQHYGMTIEKWWQNFEKNKAKVIEMYDERFYRMWRLYLIGAMLSFRNGSNQLSQWTFKKGRDPSWPLTRSHLYK